MESELSITKQKIRGVMFKVQSDTYPEIKNTNWEMISVETAEKDKKGRKKVQLMYCTLENYRKLILPFWELPHTRTVTFEVYNSPVLKHPVLYGVSEIEPAIEQLPLFS